ncbi:MAG TPA: sugar-binding domain-containing protein [bacterium]|nr:sugar-binding domain-containing protein [bacterium]
MAGHVIGKKQDLNPSSEPARSASLGGGARLVEAAEEAGALAAVEEHDGCRRLGSAVRDATAFFDRVTMALVGIGAIEPSRLLASSGNVFSLEEIEALRRHGVVGDICLRFFDRAGVPLVTTLDGRTIGMTLE